MKNLYAISDANRDALATMEVTLNQARLRAAILRESLADADALVMQLRSQFTEKGKMIALVSGLDVDREGGQWALGPDGFSRVGAAPTSTPHDSRNQPTVMPPHDRDATATPPTSQGI